jgi:hypothetical protein
MEGRGGGGGRERKESSDIYGERAREMVSE